MRSRWAIFHPRANIFGLEITWRSTLMYLILSFFLTAFEAKGSLAMHMEYYRNPITF